ncbi:MAG: mechanosensitive ion channel [Phycisphaerales bacterium]|nr:MAG: mechanosensitive ion channel [Phycisphaerales bacterium]
MLRTVLLILLHCTAPVDPSETPKPADTPPTHESAPESSSTARPDASVDNGERPSEAERIVRLERAIEEGESQLRDLKATLDDPEAEYQKAKTEFSELDQELQAGKEKLRVLREAGKEAETAALEAELNALEERWKLAKDHLDLAIEERKTLEKTIATLEQRLQQDRDALTRLTSPPDSTASQLATDEADATGPEASRESPEPTTPATPAIPAETGAAGAAQTQAAETAEPPSEELVKAQEEAQAKEAEAREAEQEARSVTERIETLQRNVALESESLETARKKVNHAREAEDKLREQVRTRSREGAPQAELEELWTQIDEVRKRLSDARQQVAERVERLGALQAQLGQLQSEQILALQEAERKRGEAEQAAEQVKELENPFSLKNLQQWVYQHGPRIAGIIVGMFVLLWCVRLASRRIVDLIVSRADHGTKLERANRARTLVSVFRHMATVVVIVGGILMILAEMEVDIVPLMGGVAVVGLAVAFGAQSLIKDYFYGFMILMENQYGINDVVKIGGVAGLVERVTLRVTILRDLEGTLHFVPHGQATTVSNLTHGWSRTVLDIGVGYKEDVDKVIAVLTKLAMGFRNDPDYRHLVLDDPEILGVDGLDDSAVIIKMIVKTRPLQQWTVKRELLRRIKNKFDELGIEIPFPHRTVYHRYEDGPGPTPDDPRTSSR